MMTRLGRWRWLLGLVAMLLVAFLCRGWWLPALAPFLDVSEPPTRVDLVFVLGGGPETRPFVAAALVKKGIAKRALLAKVKPPAGVPAELYLQEQELLRRVLERRGVPAQSIVLLPDECTSTFDEAQALAKFLDREPNVRVAVVTNDFHTRRARLIFGRVLGERMAQITFVAAPTDGYSADDWWQYEEGVVTYTTEYLKLIQCLVP